MTILVGLKILIVASTYFVTALQTATDETDKMECGVRSLYTAIVALGNPNGISYRDLRESLPGSERGHSLAQLEESAKRQGFVTLCERTDVETLAARGEAFVCIAHVNGDHFLLIQDVEPDGVVVIDTNGQSVIAREAFATQWEGNCLLISSNEIASTSSLRLSFRLARALKVFALFTVIGVLAVGCTHLFRRWKAA